MAGRVPALRGKGAQGRAGALARAGGWARLGRLPRLWPAPSGLRHQSPATRGARPRPVRAPAHHSIVSEVESPRSDAHSGLVGSTYFTRPYCSFSAYSPPMPESGSEPGEVEPQPLTTQVPLAAARNSARARSGGGGGGGARFSSRREEGLTASSVLTTATPRPSRAGCAAPAFCRARLRPHPLHPHPQAPPTLLRRQRHRRDARPQLDALLEEHHRGVKLAVPAVVVPRVGGVDHDLGGLVGRAAAVVVVVKGAVGAWARVGGAG